MNEFHTVAKGDTLGKIAKENGTTVSELKKLNNIKNPDHISVGDKIALRKEVVLGVQPLFLDRNRDPIKGLEYLLEYAGKVINGVTQGNGLGKKIFTESAEDDIKVFVKRVDGSIKEVGRFVSGYGNKLVTLISPSVKIEAKTEKHPDGDQNKNEKIKTAYDPKKQQPPTTDKKELGAKTKSTKTTDGKPITVVEGDIPDLSFLGEYVGGEVTKDDIEAAAKDLKCEAGLIYAIAKQESAHSSFIKIGNRTVPNILYERHKFQEYSGSQYSSKYPDISGPAYHRTRRVKKEAVLPVAAGNKAKPKTKTEWDTIDVKTGKTAVADDVYGPSGFEQYKRLAKAYQLDKEAALKACSWGKFQIMGFNYQAAGYNDVFDFVKAVSSGEPAHIKAFLKFAKSNKTLSTGLKEKDFEKIAEGHNGGNWKSINPEYADNLKMFYDEYNNK